jgi:hypothetical protein
VAGSQQDIVLANGTATIEKIMDVMYHEYGTESILVGTTPIRTGTGDMDLTSIGLSKDEHAKNLLKELKSRSNLLLNFENALIPEEYSRGK